MTAPPEFLGVEAELSGLCYLPGKAKDGAGNKSKKSPGGTEGPRPPVFQVQRQAVVVAFIPQYFTS